MRRAPGACLATIIIVINTVDSATLFWSSVANLNNLRTMMCPLQQKYHDTHTFAFMWLPSLLPILCYEIRKKAIANTDKFRKTTIIPERCHESLASFVTIWLANGNYSLRGSSSWKARMSRSVEER